jgi:hypothetical protein
MKEKKIFQTPRNFRVSQSTRKVGLLRYDVVPFDCNSPPYITYLVPIHPINKDKSKIMSRLLQTMRLVHPIAPLRIAAACPPTLFRGYPGRSEMNEDDAKVDPAKRRVDKTIDMFRLLKRRKTLIWLVKISPVIL